MQPRREAEVSPRLSTLIVASHTCHSMDFARITSSSKPKALNVSPPPASPERELGAGRVLDAHLRHVLSLMCATGGECCGENKSFERRTFRRDPASAKSIFLKGTVASCNLPLGIASGTPPRQSRRSRTSHCSPCVNCAYLGAKSLPPTRPLQ